MLLLVLQLRGEAGPSSEAWCLLETLHVARRQGGPIGIRLDKFCDSFVIREVNCALRERWREGPALFTISPRNERERETQRERR